MSRNCLLKDRRSLCVLFILIVIPFVNRVACENESKEIHSKPSIYVIDTTLVYTFSGSPSVNQIQFVPNGGLLVAATDFVYLLTDATFLKDDPEERISKRLNSTFLGKDQFPNGSASPVNEIKLLIPVDEDQYLVCGTINNGKCYSLKVKMHPDPKLKLKDNLEDAAKFNWLGHSEVRCEKRGFFQDPFNCSRFYSCFRRGFDLFRSEFKDCPFVHLKPESTSLVFNEDRVHCDLPQNTQCKSDQPSYERFEYLARRSRMLLRRPKENLFVLASEPDADPNEPTHLPILAKLQFNGKRKQFELCESGQFASSIDLNANLLRLHAYRMEFVYLYEVTNYVFVLKREKENRQPMKTRLGKLVVDLNDQLYSHGYVELLLSCTDPDTGESFTYAESAHFGFGDSWMSKRSGNSSGLNESDDRGDTLFVTFNSYGDDNEVNASKGSLLCAFRQETLKNEFGDVMERCRLGKRNVRLMTRYSAINDSTSCSRRKRRGGSSEHDEYLESLETVEGTFLYKLKGEKITALVSTVHRRSSSEANNLFALGTAEGKVYRLVRENGKLNSEIKFNFENLTNFEDFARTLSKPAINGNPLIDESDHAYFTASHCLIRVTLSEKECRGKRLDDKQIDAIGSAMGECKISFNSHNAAKTVGKESATVNVVCFLSNHTNYITTCRNCIEELIEETWTCGYTSYAKVFNRMCSVEYDYPIAEEHPQSPVTSSPVPTTLVTISPVPTSSVPTFPVPRFDPTREPETGPNFSQLILLLTIFASGFLAFALFCCVQRATCNTRGKRSANKQERADPNEGDPAVISNQPANTQATEMNNQGAVIVDWALDLIQRHTVINEDWLQIGSLPIGKGHYGGVYRGTLKLPNYDTVYAVAVKKLRNGVFIEDGARNELFDEARTMQQFRHENILTLIGVCISGNEPMLVLPFMKNGDLLAYIRSEDNSPTLRDLLQFAVDIGNGMSYLSAMKYVHRDLAARNCMMDESLRIKVGDFGLTRDVYERNYYVANEQRELPIKWMSIEAIERNRVTTMSDVWSYGVLLWELMTRGNVPYPGLEGGLVFDFVKRGGRMAKPEICFDEIYEIMLDCWKVEPNWRPSFDSIVHRIQAIIQEKETDYTYVCLNVNYVDYPIDEFYARKDGHLKVAYGNLTT